MVVMRAVVASLLLCACDGVFGLHKHHYEPDAGVISVESSNHAHAKGATSVMFPMTPGAGRSEVLLVFAAVGSYCDDPSVPTAMATFGGLTPAPSEMLTGTPCNAALSHSYLWLFPDPPAGTNDVSITLDGTARSLHGGALLVSGVDPDDPVRPNNTASSRGFTSAVDVSSGVGDLVVSFIGQGGGIGNAGAGDTPHYVDNVDDATTLDNTAVSTIVGDAPSVSATWMFGVSDEWQAIACSLRQAP